LPRSAKLYKLQNDINAFIERTNPIFAKSESAQGQASSNKREYILALASSPILKEVVNELYRPNAKIGRGGTADVLLYESETGDFIPSTFYRKPAKSHYFKAVFKVNELYELYEYLTNNYTQTSALHTDLILISLLIRDLETAISTFRESPHFKKAVLSK